MEAFEVPHQKSRPGEFGHNILLYDMVLWVDKCKEDTSDCMNLSDVAMATKLWIK